MRPVLIAILFCVAVIFAQPNRGDIKGTISDRLGHAIASAPIEATSADTGPATPGQATGQASTSCRYPRESMISPSRPPAIDIFSRGLLSHPSVR
jgi:hypothetical protein